MRWLRRRTAEDRAHADRLAAAAREVELSRQRLADTREHVVRPLNAYAERNNFAQLIADSLTHGRRKGNEGTGP